MIKTITSAYNIFKLFTKTCLGEKNIILLILKITLFIDTIETPIVDVAAYVNNNTGIITGADPGASPPPKKKRGEREKKKKKRGKRKRHKETKLS